MNSSGRKTGGRFLGWMALLTLFGCGDGPVDPTSTPSVETPTATATWSPEATATDAPTTTDTLFTPAQTPLPTPEATAEPETPTSQPTDQVNSSSPPPSATPTPEVMTSPPPPSSLTPEPSQEVSQVPTATPPLDGDGDGFERPEDCDDNDPKIYPFALEVCDGKDQNCDGEIDDGAVSVWHTDIDRDGYGSPSSTINACSPPQGYVANGTDCNDTNASAYPGAPEICDLADNDCDNIVDEGVKSTFYKDNDGDGWGLSSSPVLACTPTSTTASQAGDCNDSNALIHPQAEEVCDTLDNNCDGQIDEVGQRSWYVDADQDSFGSSSGPAKISCSQPQGYVLDNTDCDDNNAEANPSKAEVCDGVDNNCDGNTDDTGPYWYPDADGDGYGSSAAPAPTCSKPVGNWSNVQGDCNDLAPAISPGQTEVCGDTVDNNCNGQVDEGLDVDGDGYDVCSDKDCNDHSVTVHPDAQEVWGDGIDQDCDGHVDADLYVSEARITPEPTKPLHGSIQAAINEAQPGQLIAVDDGIYREPINFYGKAIKVMSMYGPEGSFIDANSTGTTWIVNNNETPNSILQGFTITGGTGSPGSVCGYSSSNQWGGGVCIRNASPTLINNIIYGNVSNNGGGLSITGGSPLLLNNVIEANYAEEDGGGLYLRGSTALLVGNTFVYNQADSRGGGIYLYDSDVQLYNNILTGNFAAEWGGGIILQQSAPILANNTISANKAITGGGVHVYEYNIVSFSNNILAFNETSGQGANMYVLNRNNTVTLSYDCYYDNKSGGAGVDGKPPASTDVVKNPLFVDDYSDARWQDDDYHLRTGSPAIDAGNPISTWNDPDGSRSDMGAYGGPKR